MDRIDIHLWLHPVSPSMFTSTQKMESSQEIARRVKRARDIQEERFRNEGIFTNAEMNNRHLRQFCALDEEGNRFMAAAMERFGLSARACTRILKIARTVADLEGKEKIGTDHLSEAVGYRFLDKNAIGR